MRIGWSAIGLVALLAACSEYDLTVFEGVEVFNQQPADAVDILMVIDDSCSMDPYQAKLGANFDEFISWFIGANVDYHIGVITTDIEVAQAGHIRGQVITPETTNPAQVFTSIVNVGVEGSGFEMGLEAAKLALTPPVVDSQNAGFLRDEASLSVIFVSDEQDGSPLPVNDYINTLYGVKGARNRDVFNASALTVVDQPACGAQGEQSTEGTRYIDVAAQTGGILGDLCSNNFDQIVTDLSLNASRLRDTFFLRDLPRLDTLQVGVDGVEIPCADGVWRYDLVMDGADERPAIVFTPGNIPDPGTRITVRYDFGAGQPDGFCQSGPAE